MQLNSLDKWKHWTFKDFFLLTFLIFLFFLTCGVFSFVLGFLVFFGFLGFLCGFLGFGFFCKGLWEEVCTVFLDIELEESMTAGPVCFV